jgi:hypothetical protein
MPINQKQQIYLLRVRVINASLGLIIFSVIAAFTLAWFERSSVFHFLVLTFLALVLASVLATSEQITPKDFLSIFRGIRSKSTRERDDD